MLASETISVEEETLGAKPLHDVDVFGTEETSIATMGTYRSILLLKKERQKKDKRREILPFNLLRFLNTFKTKDR